MNPVHFMLGIICACPNKTFEELMTVLKDGFTDTVFEELPKNMIAGSIIKLLMDGMVEMTGDNDFGSATVEEVVNKLQNGELNDRKFRVMKKTVEKQPELVPDPV